MVKLLGKDILGFGIPILAFASSLGGAVAAVFIKGMCGRMASRLMGLAGGIMLSLTYTELLPLAMESMGACWTVTALFAVGLLVSAEADHAAAPKGNGALSAGIMTAAAIALHNIPEGMAAFVIGAEAPQLRTAYAAAVFLHELPLGASAAAGIYCTTNDRRRTLLISFAAALAQPLGAITAFLFLRNCLTDSILGAIYAFMSGIVAYTALFELLPEGLKLEKGRAAVWIIAGILLLPVLEILKSVF